MVFHFVQDGGQAGKPFGLGVKEFFSCRAKAWKSKGFKIADYMIFDF
jgi:hypothetical protein